MTQAMILCAGFGTRMGEYTENLPKPMLPIGNKPILEHTINHLKKFGITEITINIHYLHEKITSYFKDGKNLDVKINYIYEEEPSGTAGAVKKAESILSKSEDFLALYGDIVTNQNYADLIEFHKYKSPIASIIIHKRNQSNSIVEVDNNNKIITFIERPKNPESIIKTQNWVNSGLYCFNKKVFEYIPKNTFYDFPKDVFQNIINIESLYGLPLTGYRCAIDSPERYNTAQSDYYNGFYSI